VAGGLTLQRGTIRDYEALAEHHYKAGRPATATRVLVLRHDRPGVVERFTGGMKPTDSDRRARMAGVVGVLVESQPTLSCRMRDHALGDRYRSLRSARQRAALLNAELRCVSRVVVHPQWRGLRLAVRLVREALVTATTPYTEAIAAMGRVHPFFEKSGMTAYRRPVLESDARLSAALIRAGIEPTHLSRLGATFDQIHTLPTRQRAWLLKQLHQWHKRTFVRSCYHTNDPLEQLRAAQRQLLAEPVYYLHDNRRPDLTTD
jgi:GNAT superfamily N-acetyltransferase